MKKLLKIPVRTLVGQMLRSGDLVMEFSSANRMIDGTRAHQKLQAARPEEYTAEVPVSLEIERGDFIFRIGGRIDGIFQYDDRVMIEEIKSTTKDLEKIKQDYVRRDDEDNREYEGNLRHWGQLKVYCYIYAIQERSATPADEARDTIPAKSKHLREQTEVSENKSIERSAPPAGEAHGIKEIDCRLTYFQAESGEILELDRSFSLTELEAFFNDLVDRFAARAEELDKWQLLRNESSEILKFPFPDYRPGQHRMAVSVYHIIEEKDQCIIQAPTGIGKTMAALFPTIKSLGRGFLTKFFYLTARTTGKAVAEKALQEMRDKGLKLKSLTLTAKEKTCFNPDSACNGEECEFARGYFDRVDEAAADIFAQDAFTRGAVEETARKHRVCPFEFSLELAFIADCIICDYNYVFDPAVYLKRFFDEDGPDETFVFLIDEAHNLVDRAREMFSSEITRQPFVDLRRTLKTKLPGIYRSMGKVNTYLRKSDKRCKEEGRAIVEKEEPDELYPILRKFLKTTEDWLVQNIKTPFREELLDLYFTASRFLKTAEHYDETYASCHEPVGKDFRLKLYCIDPSTQLEEALERCTAAVFFSATMTPAAYFRKILGCRETAKELFLPSPFPQENLCLLVCDRISTLYRQREKTKEDVARSILSLIKQKKGNYLLFFPSYKYMTMVHEVFTNGTGDDSLEVIVQTPGMSEGERDEFLEQFDREDNSESTLVGFAVMGGVFGEGIDLVGDRLTGAAVVGVGLPAICLERELIREYFINPEQGGRGFEYAYLYPGINRVLQAAGRVIRSEKDRGVILLVDERFSWQQYNSLFPKEWQPVRVPDEQHLTEALDQFWKA